MTTVEIKPQVRGGMEEILEGKSKLDNKKFERFRKQVNNLWSERKSKAFQKKEKLLLAAISRPLLSEKVQKRYEQLQSKLEQESISPAGHEEFLKLIDEMEKNGVKRQESMIELAGLRNISLDDLLQQLNMSAPFPEHA